MKLNKKLGTSWLQIMDEHSYEWTPLCWHLGQNQNYEFSTKKRGTKYKRKWNSITRNNNNFEVTRIPLYFSFCLLFEKFATLTHRCNYLELFHLRQFVFCWWFNFFFKFHYWDFKTVELLFYITSLATHGHSFRVKSFLSFCLDNYVDYFVWVFFIWKLMIN